MKTNPITFHLRSFAVLIPYINYNYEQGIIAFKDKTNESWVFNGIVPSRIAN